MLATWLSMRSIDCRMSLKDCAGSLEDKLGLTLEIAAHAIFQTLTVGEVDINA
jgi:hypothetical protein